MTRPGRFQNGLIDELIIGSINLYSDPNYLLQVLKHLGFLYPQGAPRSFISLRELHDCFQRGIWRGI